VRDAAFWVLAALMLGGAAVVVTARSLVRAAFGLAAALIATAGIYLLLTAPLLAAVQILLYTGGVLTLVVFAIVVVGGEVSGAMYRKPLAAAALSAGTFIALSSAVRGLPSRPPVAGLDAGAAIGVSLFVRDYAVPFELLSVLLLAAVIGALLLARKDGPA
jgi:NADH:ubiquinone oxidoreductase subunit 6 (subunit J)